MDPNDNIEKQRKLVARILELDAAYDHSDPKTHAEAALEAAACAVGLAELQKALDGWLCSGGALPRTWEHG